ncbi:hypothetical protein ZIOFF_036030 [Zingiber officinale]|uniref:Uncharacterized protein n=1 Tax=Zingiber officinale TaxID=94328 RepID=A0A8J5GAT6_ZINOF|nr:hypothetical protein ZIOFF_036030 [Zingiber officinale]
MAATSCARAAISAVGNVPSQIRDFLRGSRISETHLPQFLIRTPRYAGCFPSFLRLLVSPTTAAAGASRLLDLAPLDGGGGVALGQQEQAKKIQALDQLASKEDPFSVEVFV